jgi:hypothetical protein
VIARSGASAAGSSSPAGALAVGALAVVSNGSRMRSSGNQNTIVEARSPPSSESVCRNRSCIAAGVWLRIAAASESFAEAWCSRSAWTILARRSRSASACPGHRARQASTQR